MDAGALLDHLATIVDAPGGVGRVRDLILDLAITGRLVEQDPSDEPAAYLLERISEGQSQIVTQGKARPNGAFSPRAPDRKLPAGWSWAWMPQLGFINPRNAADPATPAGFVPMPLIPTDTREPVGFETRNWSEIAKGYTHVADGDVAIAKITPCFQNGKSAVFRGLPSGLGAATTELFVVRPTPGGIDPRYLHLFLRSPTFIRGGVPEMTGTAGQQRLSRAYFTDTPVPVPPLAEQGRIVAKAEELMALCDELEPRQHSHRKAESQFRNAALHLLREAVGPAELEAAWERLESSWTGVLNRREDVLELRHCILELAVQGKLSEQRRTDQPAAKLLDELRNARAEHLMEEAASGNAEASTMLRKLARIDSPPSPHPLPAGWACARLIDLSTYLVDCHNKTAPYVDLGVPLVRTSNIRDGELVWADMRYVSEETYTRWSQRCVPVPGDVLFTREAPMGEAAIIPTGVSLCLGQRTMLIRPWPGAVDAAYLLIALMEPGVLRRASHLSIGSTVKHLRVGDVEQMPIMLPPVDEQRRISAQVSALMKGCDELTAGLDRKTATAEAIGALVGSPFALL